MGKQTVDAIVEGGKATAAPPLGPALGPLGINIGQVISEINKKTSDYKGMQIPIKIIVEDDKSFTISVGSPAVSALVKKEAGIEKGSGNPLLDKVADLRIENIIKIAKMKSDSLLGKTMFAKVSEVLGTCNSMGVMVGGKPAVTVIADIKNGTYKKEIETMKTELTTEELRILEEERKRLQEELTKRRADLEALAKSIIEQNAGQARAAIKAKLIEAKVPTLLIEQLLPAEKPAAAGGKPEAGKPAGKEAAKK